MIGVTAALLLLTLLLGANLNSATRWLEIPGLGITFQTSDLAKVVLLVYLARVIGKHDDEPWTLRDVLIKLMLPIGGICALILPANFSTAALLFLICLLVMFIGRIPMKWIAASLGLSVVGFGALVIVNETFDLGALPRVETWQKRIESFGTDDRDANYQVEHAKIAIASGGLLPNGPGSGASRNYLPHPYSDMIYAFIVEEYGSLIGGVGLLMLYLILLFRAIRIANKCEKKFGALVAMGLALSLVVQALVNMAVAVNLVPVTGQPLPLVSMGGTSTWFTCLAIGIILSVSRSVYDTAATPTAKKQRTTPLDDGPSPALA
jgi:cell division protein FtsW